MEEDRTTVEARTCTSSSLWSLSKNRLSLQSQDSRNLFKISEKSSDSSTKLSLVTQNTNNLNNNSIKKMKNRSETSLLMSCSVGMQSLAIQNLLIATISNTRTVTSKTLSNNRTIDRSMEGTLNSTGKSQGSPTERKVSQGPKRLSGIVDLERDSLTLYVLNESVGLFIRERLIVFLSFFINFTIQKTSLFTDRLVLSIKLLRNQMLSRKFYEKYEKFNMRMNILLLLQGPSCIIYS